MSNFYCDKKKCRKTAWGTPEYLTIYDWELVCRLIDALEANDKEHFDKILYFRPSTKFTPLGEDWEDRDFVFFNRVIGYPEGRIYYYQSVTDFYFKMIRKWDLGRLKKAISKNRSLIHKKWKDFLKKP